MKQVINSRNQIASSVKYYELSDHSSETSSSETESDTQSESKKLDDNHLKVEEEEEKEEDKESSEESSSNKKILNNLVPVKLIQVTGNQRISSNQLNNSPLNKLPTNSNNQATKANLAKSQSNFNLTNNLRRQLYQLKAGVCSENEDEEELSVNSEGDESKSSSFNPLKHNYYLLNECNLGKSISQSNLRNNLSNQLNQASRLNLAGNQREDALLANYSTKQTQQHINASTKQTEQAQNVNQTSKPLKSILVLNNNINSLTNSNRNLVNSKLVENTKLNTKLNTKFNSKLTNQLNTQLNRKFIKQPTNQINQNNQNKIKNFEIENNCTNCHNKEVLKFANRKYEIRDNRIDNNLDKQNLNKMTNKLASNEDFMNNNTNLVNNLNESTNIIKNPLSNKQLGQFDSLNKQQQQQPNQQQQLNNQPNVNNENINNVKNDNNQAAQSSITQEDLLQPGHIVKGMCVFYNLI